ncbi:MAG: flagellar filament capping protein FliD [Gammaproteobacteria bacterium]
MIDPTSAGISNGLDVKGLVEKLVAAEGNPVEMRLARKEAAIQTQLSALGMFKSALAEFQSTTTALRDPQTLQSIKASSSNDEVLGIAARPGAQQGKFTIEIQQLAQAQRLASDAFDSDVKSIGTGKLTFQFGTIDPATNGFSADVSQLPQSITVDESNSTLKGVQRLINQADLGIQASIINDGVGHRLVLTSEHTGEKRALRVQVEDADGQNSDVFGLSSLAFDPAGSLNNGRNLNVTAQAQNARLVIDGIDVESPTNEISSVIDGVTLSARAVTENGPVSVESAFDRAAVSDSIQKFVQSYNVLLESIDALTGYDPESGESGPLSGDASIRGIASQIRRLLGTDFSSVNTSHATLASIGIETDRSGQLNLNQNKLNAAVESELDEVMRMFARFGNTSDPLTRFVGAAEDSKMGSHALVVNATPTRGYYAAALPLNFPVDIEADDNRFQLAVDGTKTSAIRLREGRYSSQEELLKEIQFQLDADANLLQKGQGVTASIENEQLVFESKAYGRVSRVDVVDASPLMLFSLGLIKGEGTPGEDIQARLGGRQADGSGWKLTGQGNAAGIEVEVLGGREGQRGEVFFSQGIAEQLFKLVENYLGNNGILDARFDGYSKRIDDIDSQRERLQRRLATTEQRYLTQFTALDGMLGKMKSTGKYLENQLANLPGAAKVKGGR